MQKYWPCDEKLYKTIRLLIVIDKSLRDRLISAYDDQLRYIETSMMPPHLQNDIAAIHAFLSKSGMSTAEAVSMLDDAKVKSISDDIVSLHERFVYHYHSGGKT